jgi:hypothetical protein
MAIEFVRSQGHQFKTMTVRFIMRDTEKPGEIQCAVSDAALDDAERRRDIQPHQRDDQFERLKDRIVACAGRKILFERFEESEPRILVRTADLNDI